MLYRIHLAWAGSELTTLVVICTDYIGSYKLSYDYDDDDGVVYYKNSMQLVVYD
jgi:hypothetical protein